MIWDIPETESHPVQYDYLIKNFENLLIDFEIDYM